MNEKDDGGAGRFDERVHDALARIERALDAAGIDVEAVGDGILEIEFDDGSKMIVNRHGVAREIWVAARSGGFHFRWDGAGWVDTRSGEPLFPAIARLVLQQAGIAVTIGA